MSLTKRAVSMPWVVKSSVLLLCLVLLVAALGCSNPPPPAPTEVPSPTPDIPATVEEAVRLALAAQPTPTESPTPQPERESEPALDWPEVYRRVAPSLAIVHHVGGGGPKGVAFLIDDRRLLTVAHAVTPRLEVVLDFRIVPGVDGAPITSRWNTRAEVEAVHPTWDMALLKLPDTVTRRPAEFSPESVEIGEAVALVSRQAVAALPHVADNMQHEAIEEKDALKLSGLEINSGIVSATWTPEDMPRLFQMDAFGRHGDSGSPVVDRRGRVVGMIYLGGQRLFSDGMYTFGSGGIAIDVEDLVAWLQELE